ncbi:MAG: Ig domain-containing protein [Verrucomicrobiia bacterium]
MRTTVVILMVVLALTGGAARGDQPKRYPVPSKCIQAESGHCYIASMDFGEEGDKDTGNKSGLLLFEDGKSLGPARAVHKDIREKGGGRYSHWTRHSLYVSASDNSDPRRNGRRYEVASTNPKNELAELTDIPSTPRRHTEIIRGARHEYTIRLGGNLDYENSHTRFNGGFAVAFQPNVSLTIANTGDRPVFWPKLVANGVRDWSTYESLLADFTRGATNDQERALFIWQAARENRYHCLPLFPDNEFHDPVKVFNSYGLNLCDDMGYCGCSLFKHAGLGKPKYSLDPKVRSLNGHMMCEAVVDDRHQFIDIDESVFYLDRECERPVSGDACARDHDLVRREVHYGPEFGGWDGSESSAAIFGNDDRATQLFLRGHEMRYTLRPGERVVFRWDNIGKYACHSEKWNQEPPFYGNSKFIYAPRLDGGPAAGTLVYVVDTPWAVCGGTLRAEFVGRDVQDKFALDVRLDSKKVTRIWEGAGRGSVRANVAIDNALQPHRAPAKHHYEVIVTVPSGGAKLNALEIETDVMAAPLSLPRLGRGDNTFVYSDQQDGPHEVTITQEWRECDALKPPLPPATPEYPPVGATIRDSMVTFKWPATDGSRAWHIQVSQRGDFRIPYRPSYDVIIRDRQWCVPYTGMFAPDTTYHWRVRARDKRGIWSEWSPAWTFRWEGPRVPVNVRTEPRDGGMVLRWEPNSRGARPVAYDVYGSDEKGFSVHKDAYASYARGNVPANFLGRATSTEMLVVSPQASRANMNKCYYRIVAVDANGTESICSDCAEMPHPHFWSKPPARGKVGVPFSYNPGIIRSLGDAQHRDEPKGNGFWEAEELTFALRQAPAWLKLDPKTGLLAGSPDAPGKWRIRLEVRTQSGGAVTQEFELKVE